MRPGLLILILILVTPVRGDGSGMRASALARSVMRPEERELLVRTTQYLESRAAAIQTRSVYSGSDEAALGRRSELPPEAVARLQAEYSEAEGRTLNQRSEFSSEVLRRIDEESNSPDGIGSRATGSADWNEEVTRSSTRDAEKVSTSDAVRALLTFVLENSVSSETPGEDPKGRTMRETIQRNSSD